MNWSKFYAHLTASAAMGTKRHMDHCTKGTATIGILANNMNAECRCHAVHHLFETYGRLPVAKHTDEVLQATDEKEDLAQDEQCRLRPAIPSQRRMLTRDRDHPRSGICSRKYRPKPTQRRPPRGSPPQASLFPNNPLRSTRKYALRAHILVQTRSS